MNMVKKKDERWATYRCGDCGGINIDGIEKFCYTCGSKNIKKNDNTKR